MYTYVHPVAWKHVKSLLVKTSQFLSRLHHYFWWQQQWRQHPRLKFSCSCFYGSVSKTMTDYLETFKFKFKWSSRVSSFTWVPKLCVSFRKLDFMTFLTWLKFWLDPHASVNIHYVYLILYMYTLCTVQCHTTWSITILISGRSVQWLCSLIVMLLVDIGLNVWQTPNPSLKYQQTTYTSGVEHGAVINLMLCLWPVQIFYLHVAMM